MVTSAASRARNEFGATRLQSWAVAGYVYMFRLLAAGGVWLALAWVDGGLRTHPLLAVIVLLAAAWVGIGTFPIGFAAALLGRRAGQSIVFIHAGVGYILLALRIAFTRGSREEVQPTET